MITRLLEPTAEDLAIATEILRDGGLVAFPTETVYGLGADGLNAAAVAKIFPAKGRPSDNPVILHLADAASLDLVAERVPDVAHRLAERFWPGPLTLVLERSKRVPDIVSAGLPTVAVRVPDHTVALALIRAAGLPLAAPSANRSGRPSPTLAAHVLADLGGVIEAIVDGGACLIGVESTVLDLTNDTARILRPGGVTDDDLAEVLGYVPVHTREGNASSPGTRHHHYRPKCTVILFSPHQLPAPSGDDGVITLTSPPGNCCYRRRVDSVEDYARDLYAFFRAADDAGVVNLHCEMPSPEGLGMALRDRLRRAAGERG